MCVCYIVCNRVWRIECLSRRPAPFFVCLCVCSCIYSWEERNCWGKIGIVETRYYHSHVFEGSSLGDLGESWRQEVGKIASAISHSRPGEAKSMIRITFSRVRAEQERGSSQLLTMDQIGNSRPKLHREGGEIFITGMLWIVHHSQHNIKNS